MKAIGVPAHEPERRLRRYGELSRPARPVHRACHRKLRHARGHFSLRHYGVIAKLLALPEFIVVIVVARLVGAALRARGSAGAAPSARRQGGVPARLLRPCRYARTVLPTATRRSALVTAFAGIAGMAVQNAVQRVHYGTMPPTTLMTGNTTQAALDAVDLLHGGGSDPAATRARFGRTVTSIAWFAGGCALAAVRSITGSGSGASPSRSSVGAATAILGQD